MIKFITGNPGKLKEAQLILGEVEGLDIDLPEIQEIDPHKIIEAKLLEAQKHHDGEFIIEDTSLYIDELNGLPGPLSKWFLKTIGNEGISNIASNLSNQKGEAVTIIGYSGKNKEIEYFKGSVKGDIVKTAGTGFGWDPIFKPAGYDKTFGEMNETEKNAISMRKIAFEKLRKHLNENI
jgi:inosine triphosphate pyrophosphatase